KHPLVELRLVQLEHGHLGRVRGRGLVDVVDDLAPHGRDGPGQRQCEGRDQGPAERAVEAAHAGSPFFGWRGAAHFAAPESSPGSSSSIVPVTIWKANG